MSLAMMSSLPFSSSLNDINNFLFLSDGAVFLPQPKLSPLTEIVVPASSCPQIYHSNACLDALPQDILEKICDNCDAKTLLAVSSTCKRLKLMVDSNRVWRRLLLREMRYWPSLSSCTLPGHQQLFFHVKRTYLQCSPFSKSPLSITAKQRKTSLWRKMQMSLNQRPLKIVVFGPGLEHGGQGLVSGLFYSDASQFKMQGMTQGAIPGAGGGVSLRHKALRRDVDMVALYHNRRNRIRTNNGQLPASSILVCAQADAVICVVDDTLLASENPTTRSTHQKSATHELQTLLPKHSKAPLLVVTCAPGFTSGCVTKPPKRCGAVDVANMLRLGAQPRPWSVASLAMGQPIPSMSVGIEWLMYHAIA